MSEGGRESWTNDIVCAMYLDLWSTARERARRTGRGGAPHLHMHGCNAFFSTQCKNILARRLDLISWGHPRTCSAASNEPRRRKWAAYDAMVLAEVPTGQAHVHLAHAVAAVAAGVAATRRYRCRLRRRRRLAGRGATQRRNAAAFCVSFVAVAEAAVGAVAAAATVAVSVRVPVATPSSISPDNTLLFAASLAVTEAGRDNSCGSTAHIRSHWFLRTDVCCKW